ncbi:MAG: hypothetical protein U9N83_02520 [Thermodesulfobacteriota bacterium]|nr:hypothetical protein [Thermodesulfobacteriota bacterium]
MTELEKIVVTAAFTILGGVIVYVFGQVLSKFFIDPLHDLLRTVGEVRFILAFHARTIHTPIGRSKEKSDKAQEALMNSSCELIAKLHAIPLYKSTRLLSFGVLPYKKAIEDAAVQLRGLSTYMHEEGKEAADSIKVINARVEKIERLLSIKALL